ncbi:MAG: DNA-directed DNA polymerase II small subunit [Nitrososphaerota archaeon]|jgi:DNA polymerase II small subunit|nr:DNA-directed DNA polymerase II small subunit [Nitrososphaerota archaeon]
MAVAVSRALSQGYQIEPEAFSVLMELSSKRDVEPILKFVIDEKETSKAEKVIVKGDLERFTNSEQTGPSEGITASELAAEVIVVSDPTNTISPVEAEDGFKRLFFDRYYHLLEIAKRRPDSKGVLSIESGKEARDKEHKIAGLVSSRNSKKGGGVELVIDDPTGSVRLYCSDAVAEAALAMPLDSLVVAEVSHGKNGQLYARELVLPDIPARKAFGSSRRVYAVLLSDLHIGSKLFLAEDFKRFLAWLNGKMGDQAIVDRMRYVVVAGDVVDGVGVYPGQESQLSERNLRGQYALAGEYLKQIPKHMKLLIAPGNHDPVRQALPQPAVAPDVAGPLYELTNAVHLGGPANVKLDGVNFLIYHGRSLDDIIATVPELTYDRPVDAMEVLLKARHLAPTYGKRTALSPELRDMMVIDPVPDVFHAGHVHTLDIGNYRGTLVVNSGTFQAQTPFQANMGLEPISSIVPILDLSTLEIEKRNFMKPEVWLQQAQ